MVARAVFDTCVLYPALLRDLLLHCAEQGLIEPIWSERILDELQRALKRRSTQSPSGPERLIEAMRTTFTDAAVEVVGPVQRYGLPDPGDDHVVEAAICGSAATIVTLNTRHFPPCIVSRHGIEVLTPDDFLVRLWAEDSGCVRSALSKMSSTMRNPHLTEPEILDALVPIAPCFVDVAGHHCREQASPYRADTTHMHSASRVACTC